MPESVPVSVVVPCWRCGDTITRAVDSIAAQTRLPREVILVDDASGNGTVNVLRNLMKSYPQGWIKVIKQPVNGGPGVARNAGWEAASAPYIAFLDADDAWHPRKLEIQWAWLESHPEVVLCGHASQYSAGRIDIPVGDAPLATRLSPRQMLVSNRLPTRSVILRRDLPFRFSGRRFSEDYLLWLEIIYAGYPAYRLEMPLAFCFRPDFSPGGLSGMLWQHEKGEISVVHFLWKGRIIGFRDFMLATVWSYIKFLRRLWLIRRMR